MPRADNAERFESHSDNGDNKKNHSAFYYQNQQQKLNLSDHDEFNVSEADSSEKDDQTPAEKQGGVKSAIKGLFHRIKSWGRKENVIPITTGDSLATATTSLDIVPTHQPYTGEISAAKRQKARERWKKAKSILVAIIRWKNVQSEI